MVDDGAAQSSALRSCIGGPAGYVRTLAAVERGSRLMTDLHQHPPMTLGRLHARHAWILPVVAVLFVLLALGAAFDALPWDKPNFDDT
jgi:hypothetical protein